MAKWEVIDGDSEKVDTWMKMRDRVNERWKRMVKASQRQKP